VIYVVKWTLYINRAVVLVRVSYVLSEQANYVMFMKETKLISQLFVTNVTTKGPCWTWGSVNIVNSGGVRIV